MRYRDSLKIGKLFLGVSSVLNSSDGKIILVWFFFNDVINVESKYEVEIVYQHTLVKTPNSEEREDSRKREEERERGREMKVTINKPERKSGSNLT